MRMSTRHKTLAAGLAAALVASGGLTGCSGSSSSSSTPTLTWFINPDGGGADPTKGGQAQLAKECTDASGGKYTIQIEQLPNSASDQRIQVLRRLAAGDTGMDLMSLDPVYVPELAEAGYLAPVPSSMVKEFTNDRVQSAIDAATWKGKLVAVPFWANTQLLWYRKSVAKKAGLDMSKPVTWDQLVAASKKTGAKIGVQGKLYEGLTVWINALVESSGGKIIQNPGATYDNIKLGLDSAAGRKAAAVIREVATSGAGGPAVGSSSETEALNLFEANSTSGFMVNWPYVYAALQSAKVSWMDDVAAVQYPRTLANSASKAPFGGIDIGVGAKSQHTDLAYQAARCITSEQHQVEYMVGTGNPASSKAVFSDPKVTKAFPNGIAALIRTSLDTAAPRPQTQYYGDVSTGLQEQFSPPNAVNSSTPAKAQDFILKVLEGKALL